MPPNELSEPSTFPDPEVQKIQGKIVKTWRCKCGQHIGEFSAWRAWEIHGKIIYGECTQEANPEYKEYLNERKKLTMCCISTTK